MKQLTDGPTNHVLTNVHVWSHDGQWIYYDVRSDLAGGVFDGDRIERVHVASGTVDVVYQARHGAHVGVVTASPTDDCVAFIHGPENPTDDWHYNAYHRRGVIWSAVDRATVNLDARDVVSPYTPGALRGGSHVHVFSPDGRWVSFTYEDHVLATTNRPGTQSNRRCVGVSAPLGNVTVPKTHPRNHDGEFFSVVVTEVTDQPQPGSDQIWTAYEDAWIGDHGYVRADGTRQERALAFIGDCVTNDGDIVAELFVVDLPDDITIAGDGPLCGTETTRPSPPRQCVQRRLTYTSDRRHPGLAVPPRTGTPSHGTASHWPPRYWPRSSPDGSMIATLMKDDAGLTQLWLVSPAGGPPRQLTSGRRRIASAFTFRPDGRCIACVIGDEVCEVNVVTGETTAITEPTNGLRPEACVYSPDGRQVAFARTMPIDGGSCNQVFVTRTQLA